MAEAAEEPPHILVIDDDLRLSALLLRYLSDQGFRVTTAGSAEEGRARIASITFDLLVVDVMMPGESGLELTRSLREETQVPILILSAMGGVDMRIEGLASGADDYLAKPFEPRELVLRINAILRRVRAEAEAGPTHLRFGPFVFDLDKEILSREGETIHLTAAEGSLLVALARHAGEPISREQLAEESPQIANPRTIDVQVTRLRRKLEDDPRFPQFLQTVRGIGYLLVSD
ncbi:MAG: response regulator [Planctomycetota bacterium]